MFEPVIMDIAARFVESAMAMIATFASGVAVGARLAYRRIRSVHVSAIEASMFFFISALVILVASYAFTRLANGPDSILGDYTSPVAVLTTVDGVDGPAVHEHGLITLRLQRCNNTDHVIKVLSFRAFYQVNNAEPVYELFNEPRNRGPGCTTVDRQIALPENVTPGDWIIAGEDRTTDGAERRQWTSEVFHVVAGDQ